MVEATPSPKPSTGRITVPFPKDAITNESSKDEILDALKLRIKNKFSDAITKLSSVIKSETDLDVKEIESVADADSLSHKALWLLNQLLKTMF